MNQASAGRVFFRMFNWVFLPCFKQWILVPPTHTFFFLKKTKVKKLDHYLLLFSQLDYS